MPLVSANGKKISSAEARMNDLAMGLLLSRFQVVIFNYSPSDDTLILSRCRRRIKSHESRPLCGFQFPAGPG